MVTEGRYQNPQPFTLKTGSRGSQWILIFSRLDDTDELNSTQKISSDTRLPAGHAIPAEKWKDFMRAFARYFMFKESRHQNEINQMFMLGESDYRGDKLFEDCDGKQVISTPVRDKGLLEHSELRASLIAEALKKLPAYGMEDIIDLEKESPKIGEKRKRDNDDEAAGSPTLLCDKDDREDNESIKKTLEKKGGTDGAAKKDEKGKSAKKHKTSGKTETKSKTGKSDVDDEEDDDDDGDT